ncbi:MAG: hypothetical protein JJLCMIEE_02670 [Acidimicrobiales bacterium]|nr:MAG: hypothetical protein EDR02_09190 [Actinomycetota bacterium]MBV6509576.1 hypothetical protein [Acidimicrobiales bacterium]RIK06562.1 MAG: hypothetical protein DCC48_06515 [Acidobacteriota bacterium]
MNAPGGLFRAKEALKSAVMDPKTILQEVLRRSGKASYGKKVFWDAVDRPHYAYCVYQAASQAKSIGLHAISVIEFGVAGGNGLVALERIGRDVEAELGVKVHPFGFDTGSGMPEPLDYRDLPYLWRKGDFEMDVDRLRERLTDAELVLGNVRDTVPSFIHDYDPPPIGFIAFDLDFYSSTVDAMQLCDAAVERFIPRAFCYMDDVIGSDVEIHCEFVGELLAIEEFNTGHQDRKMAPIHGLQHKRPVPALWNSQIWVLHLFEHPEYGHYIEQPRAEIFDLSLED